MRYNLPENCENELKDLVDYEGNLQVYWFKKYNYANMTDKEIDKFEGIAQQLESNGYVNLSWADSGPPIIGSISNEGRTYFENQKKMEKEQRKMNRREWRIAIVSAIIGALVGLIPYFITLLTGGIK